MSAITSSSVILRPGPEEAPDYAVLPFAVVFTRGLQPEDLGVLASLLLRPAYASTTTEDLLTEFSDGGWRIDSRRFAEILARLLDAGHLENIEADVFAVRRTPRSTATEPAAVLPQQRTVPERTSFVYAIQEEGSGRVKIGRSENPQARLKVLRTGTPVALHLLWCARGGAELEAFLHDHFARRRVRGEWFDFSNTDAVAAITKAVAGFGGAP